MRMRPFIWAAVLVGGFWYMTSVAHWNPGRLLLPIAQAGRLWTAPSAAHSAGFSTDENNNIEIYKLARPATANITSSAPIPQPTANCLAHPGPKGSPCAAMRCSST